jgi:branched-chain amino acid aminotransferase
MKIYIDGKYYSEKNAKVSVFDHGLLYGDGVFEGIRCYNGRVFRLEQHIDRLYESAKAIVLNIPMSKPQLTEATVLTCRKNKIQDGYIRLVITRGTGYLGLSPYKCKRPSIIIIAATIELYPPELYTKGLDMITVPTWRTPAASISPQIKSLNYLNNIMAKVEALHAGCMEAVMLNHEGFVAECTGDNIFILKDGALLTPPISAGALNGITRRAVIELAKREGIEVREPTLTRFDLYNADECFLTGTAAEVIPVVRLDGRQVGNGKPGQTTLRLMEKFHELTRSEGTPIY